MKNDFDVGACLKSTLICYLDGLDAVECTAFAIAHPYAAYTYAKFKADVFRALSSAFPQSVTLGKEAIRITVYRGRRSTDEIDTVQYSRYTRFFFEPNTLFAVGICFLLPDNTESELTSPTFRELHT